ncbi:MAG TPA: hypothetical protein H9860_11585 [Candidatus Gemmiger faecavium]|nr:hypothetical protein [Candidatus Gemmiger faecavium]
MEKVILFSCRFPFFCAACPAWQAPAHPAQIIGRIFVKYALFIERPTFLSAVNFRIRGTASYFFACTLRRFRLY